MNRGRRYCWNKFRFALVGIFILWAATLVQAQLPTGTILGTVKDASDAVVPGATIVVRNVDTGLSRMVTTETDGSYRFSALPVGKYEVEASGKGFNTETRTGLTLTVSQEAVINITLIVGSATQRVEVTEEAISLDTTTSSLGGLVSEQKIAELPLNGRNYLDLTLLQTGVINASSTEGHVRGLGGDIFSSNGAPTRSNNYMLDGAIMQNLYGMNPASVAQTELGVDGIKEYKTITDLFSAEYGLTMGSQTTIVSRGGTNQFHGDIFEFLRNSALDARNYFDSGPLPLFQQNQFGAAGGGPIKRDKTFFYGVYEGFRNNLGLTTRDGVPDSNCHGPAGAVVWNGTGAQPNGSVGPCTQLGPDPQGTGNSNTVTIAPVIAPLLALFPNPNLPGFVFTFPGAQRAREDYGQMRVDENFSSSNMFFARYTADDTTESRPDNFPAVQNSLGSRSQYLTLSENHVFSPALINTFRASYSRTGFTVGSVSTANVPFLTGQTSGSIDIGGVTTNTYGPNSTTGYVKQNILTFSDDIFWTKGKHAVKIGALINRYGQGIQHNFQTNAGIAFASMVDFLTGFTSSTGFTPPNANVNRYYRYTTIGFYVQDDVRLTPRLTLNLGLRYEFNTTPREMSGREYAFRHFATDTATTQGPVVRNASLKNFSPRVGFAWDVFGNEKMSVRGGAGIYYDIGNFGSALQQDTVATPPLSFQGGTSTRQMLQLPLDQFTPFVAPFQGASISTLDYYVKQPYSIQYNLTVERQLPADTVLSVSYVGSRGIHLWNTLEGNYAIPTSIINGQKFWDPFAPNYTRVNPFWSDTSLFTTRGDSWYNSLQVGVTKRVTHGLQFQGSYTWGKLQDTTQGQTPAQDATTNFTTDPIDPRTDRGPSEIDLAHQLKLNMLYHFPSVKSNGISAKLLNGWWMGSIATIQSGFAFSPTITFRQSNDFNNAPDRPDLVTSANVDAVRNGTYMRDGVLGGQNPNAVPFDSSKVITGGIGATGVGWFNPNMFIPGPPGFLGNAGRGIMRGPGLRTWDISLSKDTKIPMLGEAGNLQFRAEFFNVLNHANFGPPDNSTWVSGPAFVSEGVVSGASNISSTSGQISSTATPSRQIQFGLKVEF